MNDIIHDTRALVKNIEPLFYNLIRTSQHHKLDTIQISTTRAREIQRDLLVLKKRLQEIEIPVKQDPEHFSHLDEMFNL
jgi:hypothetical protein